MNNYTQSQRDQIPRYLALDEDELFALIPSYLPEYEEALFSPPDRIKIGKSFFERRLEDLRRVVCEDFNWPARRGDPGFSDTVSLVAAIADVISSSVGGVPPFVIASLLVRKGLDNLCRAYLPKNKPPAG